MIDMAEVKENTPYGDGNGTRCMVTEITYNALYPDMTRVKFTVLTQPDQRVWRCCSIQEFAKWAVEKIKIRESDRINSAARLFRGDLTSPRW